MLRYLGAFESNCLINSSQSLWTIAALTIKLSKPSGLLPFTSIRPNHDFLCFEWILRINNLVILLISQKGFPHFSVRFPFENRARKERRRGKWKIQRKKISFEKYKTNLNKNSITLKNFVIIKLLLVLRWSYFVVSVSSTCTNNKPENHKEKKFQRFRIASKPKDNNFMQKKECQWIYTMEIFLTVSQRTWCDKHRSLKGNFSITMVGWCGRRPLSVFLELMDQVHRAKFIKIIKLFLFHMEME